MVVRFSCFGKSGFIDDRKRGKIQGLCFNLSLNFGVAFTYPLFISVGAVLIVPMNLMVDILYREEAFTTLLELA